MGVPINLIFLHYSASSSLFWLYLAILLYLPAPLAFPISPFARFMHSFGSLTEQFILLVVFLQTHIFCRYFTRSISSFPRFLEKLLVFLTSDLGRPTNHSVSFSYNAIQKSRSPTTNSLVNLQEESCFQTNAGKLRFDDNFSPLK